MTQARQACERLAQLHAGLEWELVGVRTSGDTIRDRALREAGGKGLFVKELDDALLSGTIDCAIHSLKDVPTTLADDIFIACVPERADARDLFVSMHGVGPRELAKGSRVGSSSPRRSALLLSINPGLRIELLRGNVETRLRRVTEGAVAATFLAAAGLARLGLDPSPAATVALDPHEFIPSPGQGALAWTARRGSGAARLLEAADDPGTRACVEAERSAARVMGGSCFLPLGAYADLQAGQLHLAVVVCDADGNHCLREHGHGDPATATEIGATVGRRLLDAGADRIIAGLETGR